MSLQKEIWKQVPGYEHYEVSSLGNVRCLAHTTFARNRWGINPRRYPTRQLKPIEHRGYHVVKLGSPNAAFGVHQIVAWACIGPQPADKVVNHIDGNKQNNTPGNLEYISNSDNVKHAYATGLLDNRGSRNGNSREKRRQCAA